jgi:hypothetical protein
MAADFDLVLMTSSAFTCVDPDGPGDPDKVRSHTPPIPIDSIRKDRRTGTFNIKRHINRLSRLILNVPVRRSLRMESMGIGGVWLRTLILCL